MLPYLEQNQLEIGIENSYRRSKDPFDSVIHTLMQQPVPAFACPSDGRTSRLQFARGIPVALTNFVAVSGQDFRAEDGVFYIASRTRHADIHDGLSSTLIFAERPPSRDMFFGWWYAGEGYTHKGALDSFVGSKEINNYTETEIAFPCEIGPYRIRSRRLVDPDSQCGVFHYWSLHADGFGVARADGSTGWMSYGVDSEVLVSLSTRAGGEVASAE